MAKKRKPAAKTGTRRTPRRGKQASDAAAAAGTSDDGPSAPVAPTLDTPDEQKPSSSDHPPSTTTDPAPTDPQTSETPATSTNLVPTVVLHKKFGKYRCLFNNDETFIRKYDLGSDSETNSSVEIRVVDPCASSESDSNAALDTQSETNSGACFSPINCADNVESRDVSPSIMLSEIPIPPLSEMPLHSDCVEITDKVELASVPLPPPLEIKPVESDIIIPEPYTQDESKNTPELPEPEIQVEQETPLEEEQLEYGDDDEMITIVQIVEDDNPDYYDIKIDSPKESLTEQEYEKKQDGDFQEHFQKLNLTSQVDSDVNSAMDCSELNNRTPPCNTPDLQFHKDNLEVLSRPDPSLTPSSTLSDDSNSSRITEQNQNNSNDSAESSPTGVRRSSRIKTISNLKQKTKGYGLVKTPLKKALITQTKLKLEELGSDSQEKSCDALLNNTPNSPSFPVPIDMPVKVKSRWRRSSELEMGANSPASSPLASPSLPQRLQPVAEASLPEEEPVTPISKEAYDRIIEERMNQYQHLEENEYLCERMISKETKKMICDCFMTKEELERGELACGEDCLNRLLMIEW